MTSQISYEDFLGDLEQMSLDAVDSYKSSPSASDSSQPQIDIDYHNWLDKITDYYDDLLQVDSIEFRDEWHNQLAKGLSHGGLSTEFRQLWESLLTSARQRQLTFHITYRSSYNPINGRIYPEQSGSRLRQIEVLASELAHAYQDLFETTTTRSEYHIEGFENAASQLALETLTDSPDSDSYTESRRSRILISGYRWFADNPHPRLSEINISEPSEVYRPVGALLLVAERTVSDSMARFFASDCPHPYDHLIRALDSPTRWWVPDNTAPFQG